jgi:Flp pilus assembly protein TadB
VTETVDNRSQETASLSGEVAYARRGYDGPLGLNGTFGRYGAGVVGAGVVVVVVVVVVGAAVVVVVVVVVLVVVLVVVDVQP